LAGLTAKYGKYSILGNHDYGDYWHWRTPEEKQANLDLLTNLEKQMGFRLLLNESAVITNQHDSIIIMGVENWGKPPFKQYGDLKKALTNVNGAPFKILLSHDPTHWDAEVAGKTSVQLTLSGHTHAAQFGIRVNNFRWSLSQYIYKKWNGLYRYKDQYLYVNRGLGYIGFPGRIGMPPEITVLELFKKGTKDEVQGTSRGDPCDPPEK
jgi:predicted MPP superfamily phosphohydrolase